MVAPPWKRARDVGAALLLVALLTAPFVPSAFSQTVPVVTTPTTPPAPDIITDAPILSVHQGDVEISQGTRAGPFVNGNGTVPTIHVTIYNFGSRAKGVPVYVYAEGNHTSTDCANVDISGASQGTPGVASVYLHPSIPFDVDRTTKESINMIRYRILVNRNPDVDLKTQDFGACGGRVDSQKQSDNDVSDNVAFFDLIKDQLLDFDVSSVTWCIGNSTAENNSKCDTNFTAVPYANAPYNSARQWGAAETPNGTYFKVVIGTANSTKYLTPDHAQDPPVPWTNPDLHDYGAICDFVYATVSGGTTSNPKDATIDKTNWKDIQLDDGSCPTYKYRVDMRYAHTEAAARSSALKLTNPTWHPDASGVWHSITLPLLDNVTQIALSGDYNLSVTVDEDGAIPQAKLSNDAKVLPFRVLAPDLTASIVASTWKTTATDAYDYPTNTTISGLEGDVVFSNLGPGRPTAFTFVGDSVKAQNQTIQWRVLIDNQSYQSSVFGNQSDVGFAGEIGPDGRPTDTWTKHVVFTPNSINNASNKRYISPGRHALCAFVDPPTSSFPNGTVADSNLSNNMDCVTIFLRDTGKPVVEPMFGSLAPRVVYQAFTEDVIPNGVVHPRENFSAFINISDNDQTNLNVTLVATLTSNTSVRRYWYPCPDLHADSQDDCVFLRNGTTDAYVAHIRNFGFRNASNASEDWMLAAVARDTFDNNVSSPATTIHLKHWPIQSISPKLVIAGICDIDHGNSTAPGSNGRDCLQFYNDNSTFPYRDGVPHDFGIEFHLEGSWTGFAGTGPADQPNITSNIAQLVYLPGGDPKNPRSQAGQPDWIQTNCTSTSTTGIDLTGGKTGGALACSSIGNFSSPGVNALRSSSGVGGPGKWNLSIRVTDRGGEVRDFNYSFNLSDLPPVISDAKLGSTDLPPGKPLTVHVNVTDDFGLNATYLNFTRVTDNKTFSIPIGNFTNPANADGVSYIYNDTITTGHGKTLGNAGDYRVVFAALDSFGNWATSGAMKFKLNDSTAPSLLEASVTPPQQEAGLNVTFHAIATDESNETVTLRVLRGSEEVLRVNMTEDLTHLGNFTYLTNFSVEGSYTYYVTAIDSVNLATDPITGALSIKDNLGPRFDIRQPSNVIFGQRYAKAAPAFDILVYDSDNVSLDTIALTVGGVRIARSDMLLTPTGPDPKGFVLTYSVPATSKFAHNDTVDVNLTAIDLSEKQLQGWSNFTLKIDDVPPTTQMLPFHPASRADPRNVWNVSLQTQFTLVASDDDGLPTDVALINYQVCPLLCSNPTSGTTGSYSGPFAIKDVPGVYTGPRIYEIDYWSYDSVGNTNRTPERQLVYVDDLPPSLDPFGSVPQGRFVNVTLIDDRSGVDRAVVWYRLNDQPFTPVPLDFVNGVWSTILPEGKKGDKMQYYLQAWDRVQNTATFGNASSPYASFPVDNHNPFIKITSPADGSKIARQVQITWNATDQDNDALVFTVLYKAPPKTTYVELAKLESPDARTFVLDTTRFQDGQYTFRVTANDGNSVVISETTVTIQNAASAVRTVPPIADTTPGKPVLITAEITKANAIVEARVSRDGKFVNAYPMNDEGRDGDKTANDGIYSVRVAFDASGQYSIQIFTRYQEDGQLKESAVDGPSFGVKLTTAGVFSEYGTLIVAVGLIAIVGVGVAGYVLLRRR